MTSDPVIAELVRDVREVTGAAPPLVLEQNAPVLDDDARERGSSGGFYLVGLVGGKDVGKSALVNALVGQSITEQTSHGPGTETVIAYAHSSQERALRELLRREAPGKFRIVTHEERALARQVLVDLPDVDSHWEGHLELTRRMLRQMLFPLWLTSVEKYADQRVMEMLRRVAQGNAAENFVFCVNKVDQLGAAPARVRELSEDYAQRLEQVLNLKERPRVWTISAIRPGEFELPALKAMLAREKESRVVERSAERAGRTKTASVVAWLGEQNLPERVQRLARLETAAEELVQSRIGAVALERAGALVDDPARRLEMVDECQRVRAGRWPIVNVLHVLLSPVLLLIRENLRPAPMTAGGASADQQRLSGEVAATFAELQQEDPQVGSLYRNWKLWDAMEADTAAGALWRRLEQTGARQKDLVRERVAGKDYAIAGLLRPLLTIGAIAWFVIAQPLLETFLRSGSVHPLADVALLAVQIFSAAALLKTASFLIIYFFALWMLIRWATQRRVDRIMAKLARSDDPSISPGAAAMQWIEEILRPIRDTRRQLEDLVAREQQLRQSIAA